MVITKMKVFHFLFLLLSLWNFSTSIVICDPYSACPDKYQCCKSESIYTCCPITTICSPDGKFCYDKNTYEILTSSTKTENVAEHTVLAG